MSPSARVNEVGTVEQGPLAAVLAALARDDPGGVVAALDGQLHHGQPGSPAALRQQVGERLAVALAKQAARRGLQLDLRHGLELEADLFGVISSTAEMKEGMAAFLEKRKPTWLRG